jgi:hypothetical protein
MRFVGLEKVKMASGSSDVPVLLLLLLLACGGAKVKGGSRAWGTIKLIYI